MSELEYLKGRLIKGVIDRREFLGRAAALGVSATALSSALSSVAAFAAETPKKGGTLRLGLGGGSTTDSWDIGSYNDSVMIDASHGVFNGLIEWGEDGKPKPDLASSIEPSKDAKEWVFNLRKGIKFSNGKEVMADDAIYSLNYHRGADSKSGGKASVSSIDDITKLDTHQIKVTLKSGDADFLYSLTDYHMHIVPDGFKDWANPVGTGAFRPEKFDPGVRISLKKNPDFYKEGRGHLDAAEITVINDAVARFNALKSGQIDAINRVDPKAAPLVSKTPGLQLVRAAGGWHVVSAMAVDRPPFNNADLRLAMKFSTNREQILKALFNGIGTLGNDHPIPATDPYFNHELPQRKYDPDKAAFYYKKAGVSGDIVLQVSDAAFNGAVDMGQLMQASAQAAKIPMQIKKEPADGFWDNVWLKGDWVSSYWGGRAAATQMLAVAYGAGAPWNETHMKNDKFEKLLADAKGELDETKRKAYIWEMQALLNEDGGAIIPVFKDWVDAHHDKVGGHTPHGGFDMDNGLILEKAWIKA
jgi:peptide/nickel transport system substrate-binding protein